MKRYGLQKTTLLDYPGHVAATVFSGGCNLRCPFCHNSGLLSQDAQEGFSKEEILHFLEKRKGILEGVCITGGEPTQNPELEDFIQEIRKLHYLVKLDTNGYNPERLKDLCAKGLLDYVAMDIKAGRKNYSRATGVPSLDLSRIEESAAFLLSQSIPYEFRTTVVRGIHSSEDFLDIGRWLGGSSPYYLQNFVDSDQVLEPGFSSFSKEELNAFLELVRPFFPHASLRGID